MRYADSAESVTYWGRGIGIVVITGRHFAFVRLEGESSDNFPGLMTMATALLLTMTAGGWLMWWLDPARVPMGNGEVILVLFVAPPAALLLGIATALVRWRTRHRRRQALRFLAQESITDAPTLPGLTVGPSAFSAQLSALNPRDPDPKFQPGRRLMTAPSVMPRPWVLCRRRRGRVLASSRLRVLDGQGSAAVVRARVPRAEPAFEAES